VFAAGRQDRLVYYAFDLLWLNGKELRKLPQIERKAALAKLFDSYKLEAPVLYSEHLIGDGQKMFAHAAKPNWEGIVSKRADAPYKSERGEAWLKVKKVQREEFPVIGFVKVAAWPHFTLASKRAASFDTLGKLAPAGIERCHPRSGSSWTR
jgi:bifunctional non-homologous end joining protein LigD